MPQQKIVKQLGNAFHSGEGEDALKAQLAQISVHVRNGSMGLEYAETHGFGIINEYLKSTSRLYRSFKFDTEEEREVFLHYLSRTESYSKPEESRRTDMPVSALFSTSISFAGSRMQRFGLTIAIDSGSLNYRPVSYSSGEESIDYLYQAEVRTQRIPVESILQIAIVDGLSIKGGMVSGFKVHEAKELLNAMRG